MPTLRMAHFEISPMTSAMLCRLFRPACILAARNPLRLLTHRVYDHVAPHVSSVSRSTRSSKLSNHDFLRVPQGLAITVAVPPGARPEDSRRMVLTNQSTRA